MQNQLNIQYPQHWLDVLQLISDDEYLRSIDGMIHSIQEARREPDCNGVTLDKLEW